MERYSHASLELMSTDFWDCRRTSEGLYRESRACFALEGGWDSDKLEIECESLASTAAPTALGMAWWSGPSSALAAAGNLAWWRWLRVGFGCRRARRCRRSSGSSTAS